jgi:triosephosphate isomerase
MKADFPNNAKIVICPPLVYLSMVNMVLGKGPIRLGAQNVSVFKNGAHTGEVTSEMLADIGCEYVIVGHSERRAECQESNIQVGEKFVRATDANLTPILCVGETSAERNENKAENIVAAQLQAVMDCAQSTDIFIKGIVAYEPVWAIGTGISATEQQIAEMHQFIREWLREKCGSEAGNAISILYGGSVKPDNACAILALDNVDGALVGGASLNLESFCDIAQCVKL